MSNWRLRSPCATILVQWLFYEFGEPIIVTCFLPGIIKRDAVFKKGFKNNTMHIFGGRYLKKS
ncbi:MAG: hypothetical protein D6694_11100 [Gammaproteobacteria bacterium]|nr:MAG: hypothetical protein D6694_11100 [Gammaproteobacteria bacterium]